MIISTSSNVVSILYIVLIDVLLPIFLTYTVRIFLSSHNVKAIYKNRKPVQLNSPSPIFLLHQGMSKKRIGTAVAILSTLILVFAVAGGFSIVGISREQTAKMKAPVIIEAGSGEDVIDFTKHVSEDGRTVSKTYLHAINVLDCRAVKGREIVHFAAMSDDAEGLTTVIFEQEKLLAPPNFTCLVKEENFINRQTFSFIRITREDILHMRKCALRLRAPSGKLVKGFLFKDKDCPLEIHDVWCARYTIDVCVAEVSWKYGYSKMVVEFRKDKNDPSRVTPVFFLIDIHARTKAGSTSVRSLAYLSSVRVRRSSSAEAQVLIRLRIQTNIDIQGIKDQIEVTDVNMVFLASTLGPALLLLLLASAITYYTWRTIVAEKGLQKRNRFYSVHDLLLCAVGEASRGKSRRSEDRKHNEATVVFGVSRRMPHVGPLWESDDEGSEFFGEEELEGTCHVGMTTSE